MNNLIPLFIVFSATCERLYGGEIVQSSDISAKLVALGSAVWSSKKAWSLNVILKPYILPYFVYYRSKIIKEFISIVQEIRFKLFVLIWCFRFFRISS